MSRYIDADKLKQDLDAWAINLHKPTNLVKEDTFVIIDEQPAADVVNVVRCKDCKYQPQAVRRWDDNDTIATYVWCEEMYCADRDNYCPYGRKDGEDE